MSTTKIRTFVLVLTSAVALSGCAVVPYSPNYDDYRAYPSYPPGPYYDGPIVAPTVIWGGWVGPRWHGHRHGHRHGGGWHRGGRR